MITLTDLPARFRDKVITNGPTPVDPLRPVGGQCWLFNSWHNSAGYREPGRMVAGICAECDRIKGHRIADFLAAYRARRFDAVRLILRSRWIIYWSNADPRRLRSDRQQSLGSGGGDTQPEPPRRGPPMR